MSGNRVSYNFNNINNSQQLQTYQQYRKQKQAEIRYYVYQDLQNLINLIYAMNAVLEHFKNELTHPMITLSNNKILLQLNMSCLINLGQTQQYKNDPNLLKFLKDERIKAFNILKKVIGSNEQLKNNSAIFINNRKLENELQRYKQFYETQKFELNQFQIQETGLIAKFDESVFSKIVSSIQIVDLQIDQLRNGQSYDSPSESDILSSAQNYLKNTEVILQQNFLPHAYQTQDFIFFESEKQNPIITNYYRLKEAEQNLICDYQNHNQPIIVVVLDPNKNQRDRLLCSVCFQNFETNHKTIGLSRVYQLIQENHQEICELRNILVEDNIKQLKQLQSNFIQLNSFIKQQLDQMIDITSNWINNFNTHRNVLAEGSFYKGLDLLIKNELKVDNDKIVEEINNLNNQWIEKVKNKLEQFKQFKEYTECEKVLYDLKNNCNSNRYALIDLKQNKLIHLQPQQIKELIN